jgi:flagellar hook assembly protein FlgD
MEPRNISLKIRNIPEEYALAQNYPNPFNPVTTINYNLPDNARVSIVVYDLMGRIVSTLVNNVQTTAGYKSVIWNATDDRGIPVSAGLYFYQIHAGNFNQVRKMALLK